MRKEPKLHLSFYCFHNYEKVLNEVKSQFNLILSSQIVFKFAI